MIKTHDNWPKPELKKDDEPLEALDLRKCKSVGQIVAGMSKCSFGARMLGEVALTLESWIRDARPRAIVYDGLQDSSLGALLAKMVERKWFNRLETPESFVRGPDFAKTLIVGGIPERLAGTLFEKAEELIFINQFGIAKHEQVKDGFYPNVVFCEPSLAVPLVFAYLDEAISGETISVGPFLKALDQYGGLASEVSQGERVLHSMFADKECSVFVTVSGAMSMAKMGLVLCDMIETGRVLALCTTGALMAHGLAEGVGLRHYKYHPGISDDVLADRKLNRVNDTLEPESNLNHIESILEQVTSEYDGPDPICPRILNRMIGKWLHESCPNERGILKSAYEKNVPVFIPAFHDSELGNDLFTINLLRERNALPPILMNQELDTRYLLEMASNSHKLGIFTVGGGVPRNYIQNLAALMELIDDRTEAKKPIRLFHYGCRICPDPAYYGHLSGCTYSEGKSWRKMEKSGLFAEVHADATIVWPFLAKSLFDRLSKP